MSWTAVTSKGGDRQTAAASAPSSATVRQSRRTVICAAGLSGLITLTLLAACASYKPTVPPSEAHISRDTVPVTPPDEKILPPVTVSDYVPMPKPRVKLPTYSVVVTEVPVKELLFALARDTKQNIDVHPNIQGVVSINAVDETFPAILERIASQANVRYRTQGKTIVVVPDTPYFKTYRVDYVNVNRNSDASVGVSGDITTASVGEGQAGASEQGSSTTIGSTSEADFWGVLRANLASIISATKALSETEDEKALRAEAQQQARQERILQAEAVAGAGGDAAGLFDTAFGDVPTADIKSEDEIIVNAVAGTVTVLGTEKQHALVQAYLDGVTSSTQRQVLIEATIAEVQLSNSYQAGIDWSRIAIDTGWSFEQSLTAGALGEAPRMVVGYSNPLSDGASISASLKLLEQFGNTRVLSSPKLMALNNQPALLKVVDNVVYFEVEVNVTTTANVGQLTTFDTTARTVPVGLIMSVLPQVSENGTVSLTVRPTISRVLRFVKDPNPALVDAGAENLVPEIQVREMESMLQVGSGQTVVLGGLMQDDVRRDRDQVPFAGSLPNVGDAFAYRDEEVKKSELIVFLKPTVVANPSLDSNELKFFQRFLPSIDPTGKDP
ncbi:MAG: secretin N-terminal domain-containing protein [Betaproteobacteria bacterium]|nr:MAG: secretin N-terminal domain-containing protein [Betaproteobacteria bacterium]